MKEVYSSSKTKRAATKMKQRMPTCRFRCRRIGIWNNVICQNMMPCSVKIGECELGETSLKKWITFLRTLSLMTRLFRICKTAALLDLGKDSKKAWESTTQFSATTLRTLLTM